MIYFPWGKDQRLLADPHAFDHGPYERMCRYAPDFEVRLWTLDRAEEWAKAAYPGVWSLMLTLARPTMMVDVLRWLVVYHFGGIYWQYDMNALVPMTSILPGRSFGVRLFTEKVVDCEWCQRSASIPIRNGEPEEPVRVCNQAFAAVPRELFVKKVLDLILERARSLVPREDYDIIYICANAAVSTAYDRFGKDDPAVELMPAEVTRKSFRIVYRGTWRTDRR